MPSELAKRIAERMSVDLIETCTSDEIAEVIDADLAGTREALETASAEVCNHIHGHMSQFVISKRQIDAVLAALKVQP